MAFMIPDYENSTFLRCSDGTGDECSIPAYCYMESEHGPVIEEETGWFARLSAPGYMDCTEWAGPFATEEEARDYIVETYEVDPDSGDELNDDDE